MVDLDFKEFPESYSGWEPPGEVKIYTKEEIQQFLEEKKKRGEPLPDPKVIKAARKKKSKYSNTDYDGFKFRKK